MLCLYVRFEVVENGLPAFALLLSEMHGFRIEDRRDLGGAVFLSEPGVGFAPVGHRITNALMMGNVVVCRLEFEANTPVPCFHAGRIFAADAQIVRSPGAVPVGRCEVPLGNMARLRPTGPAKGEGCRNARLYRYFNALHRVFISVQKDPYT